MAPGVCVAKCRVLLNIGYTRFGLTTLASIPHSQDKWSRRGRRLCSTHTPLTDNTNSSLRDVTVKYVRGLPHVTVPLPSRNETCQFTLRPVSHSVGDFLNMLKSEDRGIDLAAVHNNEGIRIAAACSIENLMDDEFWLYVNNKRYHVTPPKREKYSTDEMSKIGDVRAIVAQLYEALNVGEHQVKKERELFAKLEELNDQLSPLEQKKNEVSTKSMQKTNVLTWVGLGLMSVQFGILARLTWWEYSWDIMEPVTYFVTYGTAMAAYAYYCLTKQEYNMPEVRDRQYLITVHKKAKKSGFDIDTYNQLKREIAELEHDIRRLRDPLYLRHSPITTPKLVQENSNEATAASTQYALKSILDSATKKH